MDFKELKPEQEKEVLEQIIFFCGTSTNDPLIQRLLAMHVVNAKYFESLNCDNYERMEYWRRLQEILGDKKL